MEHSKGISRYLLGQHFMHLVEASSPFAAVTPSGPGSGKSQIHLTCVLIPNKCALILGVRTLDVLTLLELGHQVHLE